MRQRREIRTCEAALKRLSTAAELDSVELIFVKAAARDGYDSIGCRRSSALMPNMQTVFFQLNFLVSNYFVKVKLSF